MGCTFAHKLHDTTVHSSWETVQIPQEARGIALSHLREEVACEAGMDARTGFRIARMPCATDGRADVMGDATRRSLA